jgi:hypothetical protein
MYFIGIHENFAHHYSRLCYTASIVTTIFTPIRGHMTRRLFLISLFAFTFFTFGSLSKPPVANAACGQSASGAGVPPNNIPVGAGETFTFTFAITGATGMSINGTFIGVPYTRTGEVLFFNPNDGRVDPQPGDRLAVWCNLKPETSTLDIWGVANDSTGFRLATLKFSDILAAGKAGLTKNLGKNGTLSISVDEQNNFWASWQGGPFGATGLRPWAKGFKCNFSR